MCPEPNDSEILRQRVEIYDSILHDLRSGMTVVTAGLHAASVMLESGEENAQASALTHIERALRTAEHCSQICKRYAGLMNGRRSRQVCAPIDEVLGDLAHFLKLHPASRSGNIRVQTLGKPCVPFMHAPDLLQILVNLAINGCEACSENADVEVTPRILEGASCSTGAVCRIEGELFSKDSPCLCIEIRDAGCGFPTGDLPKLFSAYESGKEDNLGLGLAIARRLISTSAAALELEPAPDKGTIARVLANLIPSSEGDKAATPR